MMAEETNPAPTASAASPAAEAASPLQAPPEIDTAGPEPDVAVCSNPILSSAVSVR